MDGIGQFIFPNIKSYIGFFKKDKKNGFGIVYWNDKEKCFIGFWKNNKQNGFGKFISQGKIRFGTWKEGKKDLKFNNFEEFSFQLNQDEKKFIEFFKFDYIQIGNLVSQIRED